MAEFKRAQRVAELLREELGLILARKLKDPLIGLVTVTAVTLTDDLKSARVYVSFIGDQESRKNGLRGLGRASSWIRSELGHKLDLKYVPKLAFVYDETLDRAENIEALISKIKKEDDKPSNTNPAILGS